MNSTYNDGTNVTEPYDEKKFNERLNDPRVVKVAAYKVGEIVRMSNREYRVGPN